MRLGSAVGDCFLGGRVGFVCVLCFLLESVVVLCVCLFRFCVSV